MRTFEVKGSTKQSRSAIETVLRELRRSPLLALIFFVPVVILLERMAPKAHTLLFFVAIAAIVPLAALLSRATESVAAKTGDAVGGLLNATLVT